MIAEKTCGLSSEVQEKLINIFRQFGNIESVILYGSRAMGTFKLGSDIDLTLAGTDLSTEDLLSVVSLVDDLMLPHKVDLSILNHLDNASLIDHINRVGITFY